jgi:hypothetical protein
MTRQFLAHVLLALVVALGLATCGGADTPGSPTDRNIAGLLERRQDLLSTLTPEIEAAGNLDRALAAVGSAQRVSGVGLEGLRAEQSRLITLRDSVIIEIQRVERQLLGVEAMLIARGWKGKPYRSPFPADATYEALHPQAAGGVSR